MYRAAVLDFLDTDVPPESRDEWTRHFAAETQKSEVATHSAVVFRLSQEWFALPTHVLEEIADLRPIHSLPGRKGIILGLVNIRGRLVIGVSLHELLSLERASQPIDRAAPSGRLLVLRHDSHCVAAPADEVAGTIRYAPHTAREVPSTVAKAAAKYTRAVLDCDQGPVGCLDEQLLLPALAGRLS